MHQAPASPLEPGDGLPQREVEIIRHVVLDFLSTRPRPRTLDLEVDDLVQEAQLHWWLQRPKYQARRGASVETYLRHVVNAKLTDLERVARAQKRGAGVEESSLDAPLSAAGNDGGTLGDLVPGTDDTAAEAEFEVIRTQALSRFTRRQRDLVLGLEQGHSISEVSRRPGVPRPTLHDELKRIQLVFRDEGLAPFL